MLTLEPEAQEILPVVAVHVGFVAHLVEAFAHGEQLFIFDVEADRDGGQVVLVDDRKMLRYIAPC